MSQPDNYFGINANQVEIGEQQGQARIFSSTSNRITAEVDLVDSNNLDVITYDQTSGTIDFHNKTVANFTGGGGGGGGDVFLANTQTFTGVNTFNGNTVLTTADTGNINTTGTITASSSLSGASCSVTGNLECNTGTLECNDCEVTNNCTIASGNLEVTAGTGLIGGNLTTNGIGNTGDISTTTQTTTSNHIIGGDCVVTGQIVGNGGLSINSGTTTVGAISTNNITTTGTIACNSSIAGASLAAQAGDITCSAGNVSGLSLQSNGGQVLLKTGNAKIESDVNDDTRIQANANTDTIVFRLGATGADNLQLSYDSGTNKSVLRLYDFSASPPQYYNVGGSPDDLAGLVASLQNTSLTFNPTTTGTFQGGLVGTGTTTFSGTVVNIGTGVNTATITAMNDTADRMNVNAGKIQLDATATLAKTGTTSGATDIFTVTDTLINRSLTSWAPTKIEIVNNGTGTGSDIELNVTSPVATISVASSVIYEQYGVNGSGTAIYKVSLRGRIGFAAPGVGGVSDPNINLFTLPAGIRPFAEQNFVAAAHQFEKTCRIDVTTSGIVALVAAATTPGSLFVNLGTISFYAGI
mgnify:CR=1 FL=1